MTVDVPEPRVISIEFHCDAGVPRYQYGVAERSADPAVIDRDYLEGVSVKVHRMRHGCFVDKLQRHPLAGFDSYLRLLAAGIGHVECHVVDEPFVARHVALQTQDTHLIWRLCL